ncbi:MAG: glycosyltransferase family 2 protein [Blastocatellia bacterium]
METPVVIILFNRPEPTAKVFAEIRRARPRRLLLVADGPRRDRAGEAARCAAARAVAERVDWDCEVRSDYAAENLGCRRRIAGGMDWVFEQVEEAIVLEDDCVPHPDFFPYCEEMLARYRDDPRVMHIAGVNYQFGARPFPHSYYFSRYNHSTGWATWRRAWRRFDGEMREWPALRDSGWLAELFEDARDRADWHRSFQMAYEKRIDSWAYCWTFACWAAGGLTILPRVNLISNIGFALDGTHTKNRRSRFANMPVEALGFPLDHPPEVARDDGADRYTQRNNYRRGRLARLGNRLLRLASGLREN